MTDTEKNWRDAKPKWVVEAAEKEMADMKRRLALRWPEEARPVPMPFQWGAYDGLHGTPVAGEYFVVGYGRVVSVSIKEIEATFRKWRFKIDNGDWSQSVFRGPLYRTEREAYLADLWNACDKAAAELEKRWEPILQSPPK